MWIIVIILKWFKCVFCGCISTSCVDSHHNSPWRTAFGHLWTLSQSPEIKLYHDSFPGATLFAFCCTLWSIRLEPAKCTVSSSMPESRKWTWEMNGDFLFSSEGQQIWQSGNNGTESSRKTMFVYKHFSTEKLTTPQAIDWILTGVWRLGDIQRAKHEATYLMQGKGSAWIIKSWDKFSAPPVEMGFSCRHLTCQVWHSHTFTINCVQTPH